MDEKTTVSVPVTINLDAPESFSLWQLVDLVQALGDRAKAEAKVARRAYESRRKAPEDPDEDSIEAEQKLSILKFLASVWPYKAEQLELATLILVRCANVAAMTSALQERAE
jgi:hypothetical protein